MSLRPAYALYSTLEQLVDTSLRVNGPSGAAKKNTEKRENVLRLTVTSYAAIHVSMLSFTKAVNGLRTFAARSSGSAACRSFVPSGSSSFGGLTSRPLSSFVEFGFPGWTNRSKTANTDVVRGQTHPSWPPLEPSSQPSSLSSLPSSQRLRAPLQATRFPDEIRDEANAVVKSYTQMTALWLISGRRAI